MAATAGRSGAGGVSHLPQSRFNGAAIGAAAAAAADAAIEWDRIPIYAPTPEQQTQMKKHLVRFTSHLPVQYPSSTPSSTAQSVSATASSTSSLAPPKLLYPFPPSTRLTSPRYVDIKPKFISRRKTMKSGAAAAAAAATASGAAGTADGGKGGAGGEKDVESDEINPLDRRWRLEDGTSSAVDSRRTGPGSTSSSGPNAFSLDSRGRPRFVYVGGRDPKEQTAPHQFVLLERRGNKFFLHQLESYKFRHDDATAENMTLEEAEQKMRGRVRRFEKRMRSMASLMAHDNDEEGTSAGTVLERARPSLAGKVTRAPDQDRADDAFADIGGRSSKVGAVDSSLAQDRRAKALERRRRARAEAGADYQRTFDDDDIDMDMDVLDGQGDEAEPDHHYQDADMAERDELEQAMELNKELLAKGKLVASSKGGDVSLEQLEEEQMNEEIENELEETWKEQQQESLASGWNAAAMKDEESEDDEEYDDDKLTLDEAPEDGEEEEQESKVKRESAAASSTAPPTRKRPISPAVGQSSTKKIKTEGGSVAAAASTTLPPLSVSVVEPLVISILQSAPVGVEYSLSSLLRALQSRRPDTANPAAKDVLKQVFKTVIKRQPNGTVILRKEFQKKT